MTKNWRMYCGSYPYKGKTFTWYAEASSQEDAEKRMKAIGEAGRVDGEFGGWIPAENTIRKTKNVLDKFRDV